MAHQFNRTILREYDVRGIVGSTLAPEDAYALGRSFASLAVGEGAKRVAVGRDGRTHSPELEAALVRGLTEGGLDVVRVGMCSSPMLYFAVSTLDVQGGVQVTGIVQDQDEPRLVFDPTHPDADEDGFVAYPNVDMVTEMTDMLSASRSYEANITVVNVAKAMAQRALDIGR